MLVGAEELQPARGRAGAGDLARLRRRGRSLLLVGVLKGAMFFLSDLMRLIDIPVEVDFMAVASYGSATDSSGVVRILKDLDIAIEGRDVLIVEDIVDSGLTLQYLLRNLGSRDPRTLEVCALLTKPERRKVDLPIRYVGFEIPDRFVIGYGLDYAERHRNLPFVAALTRGRERSASDAGKRDLPWYARRLVAADPDRRPDLHDLTMSRFFKSAAFPILHRGRAGVLRRRNCSPAAPPAGIRTPTRRSSPRKSRRAKSNRSSSRPSRAPSKSN